MSVESGLSATAIAEESLYTDEQGVPTLFDVVLTGDQMKEAGISLFAGRPDTLGSAGIDRSVLDIDQRILAAINAALPKVTERTAAAMRDALLKEVQDSLRQTDQ